MILPDSSPVSVRPTPETSIAIAAKVAAKRCAASVLSFGFAGSASVPSASSAAAAVRFSFDRCQPETAATSADAVSQDAIRVCGSAHNSTGLVSTAPKSAISARSVTGL